MKKISWKSEIEKLRKDIVRFKDKEGFFDSSADIEFYDEIDDDDEKDLKKSFKKLKQDQFFVNVKISDDFPMMISESGLGISYENNGRGKFEVIEWNAIKNIDWDYDLGRIVLNTSNGIKKIDIEETIPEAIFSFINKVADNLGEDNEQKKHYEKSCISILAQDDAKRDNNLLLSQADKLLSMDDKNPNYFRYRGVALFSLNRYKEATADLQKCIEIWKEWEWDCSADADELLSKANYYLALSQEQTNNIADMRITLQRSYEGSNNREFKAKIINKLSIVSQDFSHHLISEPYNKRQTVLVVEKLPVRTPKSINCVTLEECSGSEWRWQPGHPQKDVFYIAHPNIRGVYYPLDSFHNFLIEDKFSELWHLLGALGAITVNVAFTKGEAEARNLQSKVSWGVDADLPLGGGSASGKVTSKNTVKKSIKNSSHQELRSSFTFNPQRPPYIPDDLHWFEHEPNWKRIASARINGGLLNAEVQFRYEDDYQINSNTVKSLTGEARFLGFGLAGNKLKDIDKESFTKKEILWQFSVSFAPNEGKVNKLVSD